MPMTCFDAFGAFMRMPRLVPLSRIAGERLVLRISLTMCPSQTLEPEFPVTPVRTPREKSAHASEAVLLCPE